MNAITWTLSVLLVASLLLTTYASTRYFYWRSRARQLHGALEGCNNDLQEAEKMVRQVAKERDFYRDTARSKSTVKERLGLTQVSGDPRKTGQNGGLHVPGRS